MMSVFKEVSVLKKYNEDSGKYEIEVIFNKVITKNDQYDIMYAYQSVPKWINDQLFEKGHYTTEETDDDNSTEYVLDTEYILNL